MPLVDLKDMLDHASHNKYAIASLPVTSLESVDAVVRTAEELQAPVILRISDNTGINNLLEMLVIAAEHTGQRTSIPLAIHFDRASNTEAGVSAIRMGCNSIGINALRHEVVEMAHGCGVPVEGQIALTAMDEAQSYIEQTDVDFLSLSTTADNWNEAKLQQIAQIKRNCSLPVGVSAGKPLTAPQLQQLIDLGVATIRLFDCADTALALAQSGKPDSPQDVYKAISGFVGENMRALGNAGRASEVLEHCRKWNPIEHVIIFNVSADAKIKVEHMLAHGRQVLSQIPGVRYVHTGHAVQTGAAYQFCWLVRFVHTAVIDTYREHPAHKIFADELFRPIAPERISIDYEISTAPW